MKKIWVYLLGVLTGFILTILLSLLVNMSGNGTGIVGASFFDEPGEVFPGTTYEVFQALYEGSALARENGSYDAPVVMLYDPDGRPFYDDQTVNVPEGQCYRQVGIYQYKTKMGAKTVPILTLMDK